MESFCCNTFRMWFSNILPKEKKKKQDLPFWMTTCCPKVLFLLLSINKHHKAMFIFTLRHEIFAHLLLLYRVTFFFSFTDTTNHNKIPKLCLLTQGPLMCFNIISLCFISMFLFPKYIASIRFSDVADLLKKKKVTNNIFLHTFPWVILEDAAGIKFKTRAPRTHIHPSQGSGCFLQFALEGILICYE